MPRLYGERGRVERGGTVVELQRSSEAVESCRSVFRGTVLVLLLVRLR